MKQSKILCVLAALCVSTLLFSQTYRQVTGKVLDTDDLPLPGAVVMVAGTKTVAVADEKGSFSLRLSDAKNTLNVSFLGMEDVSVVVGPEQSSLTIRMKANNMLEEVIVAGYGVVQNRENLTGSAFEVKSEKIAKLPAARIDNLLAGQIPGLRIMESTTTGGRTSIKIRVRGEGSLSASNEPLWVIDGVPIYTGTKNNQVYGTSNTVSPMSMIDPEDIESMTVLKDASTTALYGADGANGVILVTTKSASGKGARFGASVKYGISSLDRSTTVKRLNGKQFLELAREGWANAGKDPALFPYQDNEHNTYSTTDTDWYSVYCGIGQNMQASFNASSSSDKIENYFTASYYTNKSNYIGNSQQRVSFRNKSSFKFTDSFNIQVNLSGTYNHNDIFTIYSSYDEIPPIFDPYLENGDYRLYNWYYDDTGEMVQKKFYANKLPEREYNDNYQRTGTVQANARASWKPFKGMEISAVLGTDLMNTYEATYSDSRTLSGMSSSGYNGYSRRSGVFSMVSNGNFRANYNRTFSGKHSVQGMAGIELTDKRNEYLYATGNGFMNDSIKEINFAEASTRKGSSNAYHNRSLSYMGFASYSYDRRYTITLTARRQGYSSFSDYSRWGEFLSLGLNWNVKAEPFFNVDPISTLNVKASYGNNGNSRVDTSASYGSYSISDGNYYGGAAGAVRGTPANPGLSWENTYITNFGFNLGFWHRLNFSAEYYNRRTADLLYSGRVSAAITSGSVTRNVGEITNHGFEFTISGTPIDNGDLTWNIELNGSKNWNLITKLYKGMHTGFFDYVWMEGASKDAWWLVRWAGVDPTNGKPMWYDIDGNLTYTFSYDNRVLLPEYSHEPDLYGGLTSTLRWKNLSARIVLDYTLGGYDLFSLLDDGYDCISDNPPVEALDHWRQSGEAAMNPAFIYKNDSKSLISSTRNLYKMTNVQLRNITLTYSVPKNLCKVINLKGLELSLIGDNLYLWTPGQSSKHNSYKTLKYSEGMTRTVSGQISLQF